MSRDSDSEYECEECDKSYLSKKSLQRHMVDKHDAKGFDFKDKIQSLVARHMG